MSGYEKTRDYIQMEGDETMNDGLSRESFADLTTEQVYTAHALTSQGRQEIECYGTVEEAVQDMLELWPEDDDGDVAIENNGGEMVVLMVRGNDPLVCHLFNYQGGIVASYHCQYEPALGGDVRTVIKRLG